MRTGTTSQRKGSRGEREAVRVLSEHLRTLEARRFPRDKRRDPQRPGDIELRTTDFRIVEYIEVKRANPNRQKGPITIAEMDTWRRERRLLMCRQDRGDWLCSMWATVSDELMPTGAGVAVLHADAKTRGIRLAEIQVKMREWNQPVWWGAAIYMTVQQLAECLEDRYGDVA